MTIETYEEAKAIVSKRDKIQELLKIVQVSDCVTITVESPQCPEDEAKICIQGRLLGRFNDLFIDEVSDLEMKLEKL